ncbi:MAG: TRAP transporter substrate-binding protein DctP [Gammaproteobacteria bacterium]|nr:TRAP transporter substrate-binding protein DctP [Gammaproteobacteria bacterium]
MRRTFALTIILLLSLAPMFAGAATLKIATLAPESSSWMKDMRAGAAEVAKRTGGRVTLKFYGGGVMGNDRQVARKMRAGQLQGAAFTLTALAERYPDMSLYSLPLVFNSLEEVDYVRQRMDPQLVEGLGRAGLVSFGIAEGGFALVMSNVPVRALSDLEGQKMWVPEGDDVSYAAMNALGVSPVTLPITDVLTGLQTGLIDIIGSSPIAALVLQWHTKVDYMTDQPLSYIAATLVIEERAFDRLDAADQKVVQQVMSRIYAELDRKNRVDNAKARDALVENGMRVVEPAGGEVARWRRSVAATIRELGSRGEFTPAQYAELQQHLEAYRADAGGQGSAAR